MFPWNFRRLLRSVSINCLWRFWGRQFSIWSAYYCDEWNLQFSYVFWFCLSVSETFDDLLEIWILMLIASGKPSCVAITFFAISLYSCSDSTLFCIKFWKYILQSGSSFYFEFTVQSWWQYGFSKVFKIGHVRNLPHCVFIGAFLLLWCIFSCCCH